MPQHVAVLAGYSRLWGQARYSHMRPQDFWDNNRTISLLVRLQDCRHRAANGQSRRIQCMRIVRAAATGRSIFYISPPGLGSLAVTDRLNLNIKSPGGPSYPQV